jgi:hypothetical protein
MIRYLEKIPKKLGAGRVLMHNHIRHTVNMPSGVNGFRFWTDTEAPAGFHLCKCGWSGLPHYSSMRRNYKCESWKRLFSPDKMALLRDAGLFEEE